jgi:hypothetical protein
VARLALTAFISVLVLACGGGASPTLAPATPAPATPVQSLAANGTPAAGELPTGDQLCSLLTPDDWATAGLTRPGLPQVNSDGPGSAYCSFSAGSGAQGGLEFDAFVDATSADAQATTETATGEAGATQEIALPGVDEAFMDSEATPSVLVARKGRLTLVISVPPSDSSQAQLATLAALVVSRSASVQ